MTSFNRLWRVLVSLLFATATAALPAAAQPARPDVPVVVTGSADPKASYSEYILGPEDVVEVDVVGSGDRTRARVYADGSIQVNLIGRVQAAGKTPRELSATIATGLKAGNFYANPVVNVEIVGFASRYVTVLGAVATPGLVPINKPYRLSEIIARVGGIKDVAADYIIVRPENGAEKRYDVEKIASGATEDPMIAAGDKIYSPLADIFYIAGQVNGPGSYPMRTGMTVAQAIAKGGGLTESGTDKKVKVRRGGKTIKLKGDAKIEAGDVLTVSERLF